MTTSPALPTTIRPRPMLLATLTVAAAITAAFPAGAHAAPPACSVAAAPARAVLAAHNKHCAPAPAPATEPEPEPEPAPAPAPEPEPAPAPAPEPEPEPEPEAAPAPEPAPCTVVTATVQAGDYAVTRLDAQSLRVSSPTGGFDQATRIAVRADGAQYTFERGYADDRLSVHWSDNEVTIRGWWLFPGRSVTNIMFGNDYGVVLGGWHDLATPLAMTDELAC